MVRVEQLYPSQGVQIEVTSDQTILERTVAHGALELHGPESLRAHKGLYNGLKLVSSEVTSVWDVV